MSKTIDKLLPVDLVQVFITLEACASSINAGIDNISASSQILAPTNRPSKNESS
jgi:hypothetical protein